MSQAVAQIVIDLPRDQAWQNLKNLELAHHYVPGVIDTKITSDLREGVGASRNVYQKPNKFLQETVTQWNEGEGFRIRLHKGEKDAPFKNAFFEYKFEDTNDGKTLFTATMGYEPPMGPVGKLLDAVMLNKIITGVIEEVAASMKFYYEQGKTASKSERKAIKKAAIA